jgi:conjugal transfer/type IV secretion protein DotA/TraY
MSNPFTPSPDDGAIQMLRMVFGPVIDGIISNPVVSQAGASVSSTANMLSAAFQYFNSGVLFFTAILMSYVVIFGVANSANDGEVLGNKWSTFYTPLRTFGASAMLIPTASGYSGIQVFLLMVTTWSIGFGSNLWSAALTYAYSDQLEPIVTRSVMDDKSFEDLAMNAVRMQVCAYAVTKAYQAAFNDPTFAMQFTPAPVSTTVNGNTKTVTSEFSYSSPSWPGSSAICGKMVLSDTYNTANVSNTSTTNQTNQRLHDAIVQFRYITTQSLFDANPVTGGYGTLHSIVQKITSVTEATDGTQIDAVNDVAIPIEQIRANITNQVKSMVSKEMNVTTDDIVKKLGASGWIYAGAMYREISTIKDSVTGASKSNYTYSTGTGGADYKLSGDYLKAFMGIYGQYDLVLAEVGKKALSAPPSTTTATSTPTAPSPDKIQTNFTAADFADGGAGILSSVKKFLNAIPNKVVTSVVVSLSNTDGDPIWAIKDMGDNLRFIIESAITSKILISAGLKAFVGGASIASMVGAGSGAILGALPVGMGTFVDELLRQTFGAMEIPLNALLYAAYYMSIWVPSIPFFVYTVGVAGWLIFVIEMLAAGSLWMAAHTAPAREDSFIGSQTQGYMLVMSGFFRPALMVLGLIAAVVVNKPIVQYLNAAFLQMFQSMTSDSYIGITGAAGYLMLYCTMLFSVESLVFALPQSIPDRILRWVGAGIGDMGEQGTMAKVEGASSAQARRAASPKRRQEGQQSNSAPNTRRHDSGPNALPLDSSRGNEIEGQGGQSRNMTPRNESP